MNVSNIKSVYFIGAGGIGMSAIARYFLSQGKVVAGYDRTPSELTNRLVQEGAQIHYEENVDLIPSSCKIKEETLVVYTPAIPSEHQELAWFKEQGFEIQKRAQVLGTITRSAKALCVAGTHGKTTTSTMLAHLMSGTPEECNAFLGGIAKNYGTNYILSEESPWVVIEADEFDRSFLRLSPDVAVVTSCDPDHLDIYGTYEAVKEAFGQFIERIKPGGALILKKGVELAFDNPEITLYRYAYDEVADFYATNIRLVGGGHYRFDLVLPDGVVEDCTLGIPGWVNIENAVAAVAAAWCAARQEGVAFDAARLKQALADFSGVKRRFEFYLNTPRQVYMDDYAHHPEELEATITSVRKMFPGRHLTAVFQPHLYTRTRDLYREFAAALSHADEVVLVPIYPARELPIEGVGSEMIMDLVTVPCRICERECLAQDLGAATTDVVVSFGAGNIDAYCAAIAAELEKKA